MTIQTKLLYGISILLIYTTISKGIFALLKTSFFLAFWYVGYQIVCITFEDTKPQLPKLLGTNQYSNISTVTSDKSKYIFDTNPEISHELREIINFIIRDYVMVWFERIDQTSNSKFPKELNETLLKAIDNVTHKLNDCDFVTLISLKLLPLFTLHFNSFIKAKRSIIERLVNKNYQKLSISESSLIEEYKRSKALHFTIDEYADNLERGITIHLRKIVLRLLPYLVSSEELKSPFVSILLREILTTNIFAPLVMKFSDPDNWNLAFVNLSKKVLRERNQIHKVRRILVKGIKEPQKLNDYKDVSRINDCTIDFDLDLSTTTKEFEAFLRQLNLLHTYSDLRSTKFALAIKLLRLENRDASPDTDRKISREEVTLKKRILISLNMLDTKLKYIEPKMSIPSHRQLDRDILKELEEFISDITLDSVFLTDKICVSFFRRYLDKNNYKDAVVYLDFWILVDSLKNPLEEFDSQDIIVGFSKAELAYLYNIGDQFFANNNLEAMLALDKGLVKNIELFMKNEELQKTKAFLLARKSLFLLQKQAQKVLSETYFALFKKSNIMMKMITSPEFISTQVYSMYFSFKTESPSKNSEIDSVVNSSTNTVMIFSNSNLNDELEEILSSSDDFDMKNGDSLKDFLDSSDKNPSLALNTISSEITNTILDDQRVINSGINNKSCQSYNESIDKSIESMESRYISDTMNDNCYNFSTLKSEMFQLGLDIEEIKKELDLLKHLILKADLMDNKKQLKLLHKSQRSLLRDLEKKELLMQQLSIQENANSLYKNTTIHINCYYENSQISSIRNIVFYVINIDHIYKEQATLWEMPRRYSEFYTLHKYLKERYPTVLTQESVRKLFPPKRSMRWGFQASSKEIYEDRRARFELYLNKLLEYPEVCQDDVFRRFLTESLEFHIHASKTLTQFYKNGIIDRHGRLDIDNGLDHLKNSPLSETSSQLSDNNSNVTTESFLIDSVNNSIDNQIKENGIDNGVKSIPQENVSNVSLLKPVCDLFISLFSLNKSNSLWLRGGAIILVLQQLLGGTIEKYIKDSIIRLQSPENVYEYLISIKQLLWGEGGIIERRKKMTEKVERTIAERKQTKNDSRLLLSMLFTEVCGKVVGPRHAQDAASRVHDLVQIRCLNASLLLEVIDIILDDVFFKETDKNQS